MLNSAYRKSFLLAATASLAVVVSTGSAHAQDGVATPQTDTAQGTTTTSPTTAPTPQEEAGADIVVTGSIIRGTLTPSPVTTLTQQNLDRRGINTVQDALQQLSSNNGAALTNSFSANGAFAGGASSVSLRGLSTSSTLVLFDGLRAAYYPLADDGQRNFVDLNTIPDDIVERIDVLRDGASSSYGADAIAGVVNVITKKQFKGLAGRVEAGIAEKGFAANQRVTLTAGVGDLAEKGFNAYISGFYYNQDMVRNSDLRAPYNSDDQRPIGGPNGVTNGLDASGNLNGFSPGATDFFVRPYSNVGYSNGVQNGGVAQGRYQKLSNTSCISGQSITLSAAQLAQAANANAPAGTICQEDNTAQYGVVAPKIERFGGSARFTATVGSSSEAYLAVNFQQSTSSYTGLPATIRGNAPTGIDLPRFSTSTAFGAGLAPGSGILALPVYICARTTVGDCTAANGTLNPNNPFAAQGQIARLVGRIPTPTFNQTRSRVYRGALGISGTFGKDWDYRVEGTAMHTDLEVTQKGYVYIQNLLNVIKDGSYNFLNPGATSQATLDYLTPTNVNTNTSDLYQAQATIGKALFDLPGGPLRVAAGGSVYYEAVNSPSGNADYTGATQRYFTLNAFGTVGHRTVASAFGEIKAPIFDQLEIDGSGRYDHYSSGQSNFSPKVGVIVRPVRQVTLRGTYSRGFRIPSFAEANALPTTGYVSQSVANIPANFLSQYGANCTPTNPTGCPTYITAYSIGLTTLASPNLQPEKSRSFTAGIKFDPIRNVTFTVDYYNIRKTGAITPPSSGAAIAAYYANQAIPAGFNVIADAVDTNNPTARPRIAFVESQLINANTLKSEGIDFGANIFHDFGAFKFTSNLDASWLIELSTTFADGTRETYVDTLGNFNLTAGSGTFRWKGNWQNTIETGPLAVTGTVNYTSGYDLSAMDQGNAYEDHGLAPGYTGNRVKSYVTFDLNVSAKVNNAFTLYANVLNLIDRLPPIDPVTYGAYLYNPVQAGNNIYGRQFRAGAKFNF
ncbi:TonB-dependent receptor domain-containing protein [Sphingomonas sp. PAMC 26621]|uniref:TonB-dependent receptor domain-containing protein n=1 Tax=Sphingomonas sp. PAMC 26621 TaxID=1112213 RepID=UPI00047494D7|nr:TonB-dependent receptor [Sphingomonas sp. PAMC 26621]